MCIRTSADQADVGRPFPVRRVICDHERDARNTHRIAIGIYPRVFFPPNGCLLCSFLTAPVPCVDDRRQPREPKLGKPKWAHRGALRGLESPSFPIKQHPGTVSLSRGGLRIHFCRRVGAQSGILGGGYPDGLVVLLPLSHEEDEAKDAVRGSGPASQASERPLIPHPSPPPTL